MFRIESAGDGNLVKQELEACTEGTKKLAPEESRQHFEYVDIASVKKETDDVSTEKLGGTWTSQIVKEEMEDEISLHENEARLWGLETSSLCDVESVKQEDGRRDHSDHLSSGSECETPFYKSIMDNKEEGKMLNLIELFKKKEVLWNPSDPDHFKKNRKEDAWQEIGEDFGESAEVCKKKIISLLSGYRREKSKMKQSQGTGKGTDEVYMSRWYAFQSLQFLQDRDKPRKRINAEVTDTSGPSEQQEEDPFVPPSLRAPKRMRVKNPDGHMTLMSDAIKIMKVAANRLGPGTNDEIKAFGNYVISKMNSYSTDTRKVVEHAIIDILMKADKGFFGQTHS